jgi:hypothetical protein
MTHCKVLSSAKIIPALIYVFIYILYRFYLGVKAFVQIGHCRVTRSRSALVAGSKFLTKFRNCILYKENFGQHEHISYKIDAENRPSLSGHGRLDVDR